MEQQENNKMVWVWGIVVVVIVAIIVWYAVSNKSTLNNGIVDTIASTTTKEAVYGSKFSITSTEGVLFKYLSANISNISPQKEVLGGKFQITNLVVTSSNTAEISYSDGHIALAARFNFTIVNGVVTITKFVMLTDKL